MSEFVIPKHFAPYVKSFGFQRFGNPFDGEIPYGSSCVIHCNNGFVVMETQNTDKEKPLTEEEEDVLSFAKAINSLSVAINFKMFEDRFRSQAASQGD